VDFSLKLNTTGVANPRRSNREAYSIPSWFSSKWLIFKRPFLAQFITTSKTRYRLIDHETLQRLLHVDSHTALAAAHRGWMSSQLKCAPMREERYSKSIAVGSQSFVETVQAKMGFKAIGRRSRESLSDAYELRETEERYGDENS
jgi:hypothetical protein